MPDFFFFFSYSSCRRLCHLPPLSSSSILLRILPYLLSLFPQRFFRYFHNRLSSSRFPRRWRDGRPLLRRRNVPIKSESHVLPISRQLNLVHAHIAAAIAATRALCQGTTTGELRRSTNPR